MKRLRGLELLFQRVDVGLELVDVAGLQLGHAALLAALRVRSRQHGAQVEEQALGVLDDAAQVAVLRAGAAFAEHRVQLVHRAVGLDAQGVLGNPGPAEEIGLAFVPPACIDLHRESSSSTRRSSSGSLGPAGDAAGRGAAAASRVCLRRKRQTSSPPARNASTGTK